MDNLKPIKVRIQNYQSIEDISFEIRGFTALSGKTNIGKSAIVRAISSAILNNPVVGMVRRGAPYASVELSTDEWNFRWEKSERGVNRYDIGGKFYDKVGQRQLTEIADLGFKSVKVGNDDVHPWLASQFFPIFLLDKSGPQVTDFISEVSRLNVLQDAVVLSARGKRKTSDDSSAKSDEAAGYRLKQKAVAQAGMVRDLVKDLDGQASSIEEYETSLLAAITMAARIAKATASVTTLTPASLLSMPKPLDPEKVHRLVLAEATNVKLENTAKKVIAARKAAGVVIPEIPPEIARLKAASRFATISSEIEIVRKLSEASSVKIPVLDTDEILRLSKTIALEASLKAAAKAVKKTKAVKIPIAPVIDTAAVTLAESFSTSLIAAKAAEVEAASEVAAVKEELAEAERELAKIPVCPTCKRPREDIHDHA